MPIRKGQESPRRLWAYHRRDRNISASQKPCRPDSLDDLEIKRESERRGHKRPSKIFYDLFRWELYKIKEIMAEIRRQQLGLFGTPKPHQNIPTGPEEGLPKFPVTAEGRTMVEGMKAWGGVPSEGYDFAEGSLGANDLYAAPVLTWDNRTGQVKVLPQATVMIPGRRYVNRQGEVFVIPAKKPQPTKPTLPQKTEAGAKRAFKDTAHDVLKQYVKPTREPFIGPYEGERRPQSESLSAVGGNPKESIRDGMLLPGENPEEIRRSRDATGPKAGKPRARQSHASDQDYPMGALGYRPDEPVRDNDLGPEQTPEGIARARVNMEYERPTKPFGPIHHTDTQRTGPKDSYQGGPGNIGGKYKRRQGGRIRQIGHPPPGQGPQSTGEVWRGEQKGREKGDLHKGGMGAHKWERDESNVPVSMAKEEPETHIDPHLIRKPYPARHREITEGGGYDVESRIVPTRAATPKIIDASKPHADRQKGLAPKAKKRTTQPDNAPIAPLAKPRENLDPTGGASTEQAPRLKPTPTIPRGPKYPKDVPPVQPDTGAVGAMRATAPSGAKYVLQDKRGAPPPFKPAESTDTGSLGPDHRETLGYAERGLSKVHDNVQRSASAPESKQVNAYDARQEWKGGRLETHLVSAPKRAQIQQAAREGRRPISSSARAKLRVGRKQFGPKHTHSDVFRGPVKAERSLAKRLKEILKNFLARRLTRDQALTEGHKAIDENQARITEIARKHASRVIGKEISELAPEVSRRLEQIRTQAIGDFENILKDATTR